MSRVGLRKIFSILARLLLWRIGLGFFFNHLSLGPRQKEIFFYAAHTTAMLLIAAQVLGKNKISTPESTQSPTEENDWDC